MNEHLKLRNVWREYRRIYDFGDWWYIQIPALIITLINFFLGDSNGLLVLLMSFISLAITIYQVRLALLLYFTKQRPELITNLRGLHFGRDFIITLRVILPIMVWSLLILVGIMAIAVYIMFNNIPSISTVYSFLNLITLNLLQWFIPLFLLTLLAELLIIYFVVIPRSGVLYLAAPHSHEIESVRRIEFDELLYNSKQVFAEHENRMIVFKAILKIMLLTLLSFLLLGIPLLFIIPFSGYYFTHIYVSLIESSGYDLSTWIDESL